MCKAWSIRHTCKHYVQFRLSTCRGTFTTQSRTASKAESACTASPCLTFKAPYGCGRCQKRDAETTNVATIEDLRSRLAWADPELSHAEMAFEREAWSLHRRFPQKNCGKYTRPSTHERTTKLRGSLLRSEVQPEEVVEDGWEEYYNSWLSGCGANADEAVEYEASSEDEADGCVNSGLDSTWDDISSGGAEIDEGYITAPDERADWDAETEFAATYTAEASSTTETEVQEDRTTMTRITSASLLGSRSGQLEIDLLERLQGCQFHHLITVGSY